MKFLTVKLNKEHDRATFRCSQQTLNNYLKFQATKESKQGLAKVYVLCDAAKRVTGYYTLSSAELPRDCIPADLLKKLPKGYFGYPAILIGRLAITEEEAGKGLGGELLVDAILRCIVYAEEIGTSVIIVHPIDTRAESFYRKYMFVKLPDANSMILKIDHQLKQHFGLV
ncbi:MAG: hypothetical protein OEX02_17660 [Cyclobacteriaceae bacterium]|nr:hypothetical protein [Cyclobacteriaceae bacterium]